MGASERLHQPAVSSMGMTESFEPLIASLLQGREAKVELYTTGSDGEPAATAVATTDDLRPGDELVAAVDFEDADGGLTDRAESVRWAVGGESGVVADFEGLALTGGVVTVEFPAEIEWSGPGANGPAPHLVAGEAVEARLVRGDEVLDTDRATFDDLEPEGTPSVPFELETPDDGGKADLEWHVEDSDDEWQAFADGRSMRCDGATLAVDVPIGNF